MEQKIIKNRTQMKEVILAARKNGNVTLEVFVDRYGELNTMSINRCDEDALFRLSEFMPTPNFHVLSVYEGRIIVLGDDIKVRDLSVKLKSAIEDAQAERKRFYEDREKIYGPSAWPMWPGGFRAA